MPPAVPTDTYDEVLLFRVYAPGTPAAHRALVPSELDLALLNSQIASQEAELERVESLDYPRDVRAILDRRDAMEEIGPADAAKVAACDAQRLAEFDQWQTAIYRTRKALERAIADVDSVREGDPGVEARTFRLREFAYLERLESEDKFSTLDPVSGARRIDIARRNLDLLDKCLLGEVTSGQVKPVPVLPAKLTQVLIDRQWARAELSPDLARHFRDRRGSVSPDGPGGPGVCQPGGAAVLSLEKQPGGGA